jgi:PKD repeat protein
MSLIKNGTFLYGMEHWAADVPFDLEGVFYEPGAGSPSPGCAKLPEGEMFWQKIERLGKGRFEIRFRAKGVSDDQEFVAIEVQILDNVFQAEHSTKLPFGIGGTSLKRWVDYSAIVELPDISPAYFVFESIEADGSLYIDSVEMEPLPEELCPGLVHEVQKRRRDPNTTKHPEERYKEVVTQAVNRSPSSLWQTDYVDIKTESDQYWYQLESAVQKPEHVKRVLVHRIVGTDTEEEVIGRWTTEFGQDGYVYLQLDEPTYDGCILRVEYAQYPDFPACTYAITLPIDREWVLCRATTLLLMEADPVLEPPELIERDLQYWDAKRVAREAEVVPRPRTARARTLRSEAYAEKVLPCGDINDVVGGPTSVPAEPIVTPDPVADFHADETESSYIPFAVQFRDDSEGSIIKWTWNFGDGTGSNEEEPLHSYTEGGLYSVVLEVVDADGRRATGVKNNYINVGIPAADFEAAPLAGTDPWPVGFTDLSAGVIESWSWGFGDTETSAEQNPTHDYAATGDYTVVLTVTGPTGTSVSEAQVLPVGNVDWMPPTAQFWATNKETSDLPVDVQFTYSGRGATAWAWTFGDGGESDEENPKHTYTTTDKFTVGLTVTNEYGNDLETKVDFIVTGIPIAYFSTQTPKGYVPHEVIFKNNSKGTITDYMWYPGDGYWNVVKHLTHTYERVGVYDVALVVYGPTGPAEGHTRKRGCHLHRPKHR